MPPTGLSDRRILVVGCLGMLARDLMACLAERRMNPVGVDLPECDITREEASTAAIEDVAPALVINCAAYTAVDQAESDAETAFAVNRDGPANLAAACSRRGIPLVHISTDYIFDGRGTAPYREDTPPGPLGVYALSKWQGEESVRERLPAHVIVRTAWLYGVHGRNFVKTMLQLARTRETIRVVADQHGCPTWSADLASALADISERLLGPPSDVPWGTYHFCAAGITTWCGFARAVIEGAARLETLLAKPDGVLPITTAEYPTAAPRPAYSALDCSKISRVFGIVPRPWTAMLADMLNRYYAVRNPLHE